MWKFRDPTAIHQNQQLCPWSFRRRHECFPLEASKMMDQILNEKDAISWNKTKHQERHMKGLSGRVRSKMRANVLIS